MLNNNILRKIIIDIKQVVPINAIIVCTKLLSHPSRDAWIKGFEAADFNFHALSHPSRDAWIKAGRLLLTPSGYGVASCTGCVD